jgi:hypothetical protein
LASRYEKDIFTSDLADGVARTHAENYVRFGRRLEEIATPDDFFTEYPQLYDALPVDADADEMGTALWDLFRKHQVTVNSVLENQIKAHASEIRRGTLSKNCLLSIVTNGIHLIDPRLSYIESISSLLVKSLPTAFQTKRADNERQVQDVGEAVFKAAKETLDRESPQIPFSSVTTKPDFSKDDSEGLLFLEFKYLKDRKALNRINTEMTSRVTIYRSQGAWILFVVYDPNRSISDDDKFRGSFEKHDGVYVAVVR